MKSILFHSNILSKQDVPFVNEVYEHLKENGCELLLTGWNSVLEEWDLKPDYFKIPEELDYFNNIYSQKQIKLDFKRHNLSSDFLLDRFNWWFPEAKNENEKLKRLSFLHFHLHHYLKLIRQNNPSLLLVWNGNDPRQYIFSKLGENFGIERLFLERGPLPSVIFYDRKGVLNNSTISSLNLNKFTHGFDNYDSYEEYVKWYKSSSETLWDQPNNIENKDLKKKFGISENQKIIVFFGQVDNDIQSKLFSPYFASNLQAFEWFIQNGIAENHFVIGKHHPKSGVSVEKYQSLINDKSNIVWTNEFSLEQCLNVADYIVTVNSSVIFDSLLCEKPVFALGESLLTNKNILYEYNPDKFEEVLDLFYNFSEFEKRMINFKNMLELLLRENLIFTKNKFSTVKFADKLLNVKNDNNNRSNGFEDDKIIKNYYCSTTTIKKKSNVTSNLVMKIRKYIKWHYSRIFLRR